MEALSKETCLRKNYRLVVLAFVVLRTATFLGATFLDLTATFFTVFLTAFLAVVFFATGRALAFAALVARFTVFLALLVALRGLVLVWAILKNKIGATNIDLLKLYYIFFRIKYLSEVNSGDKSIGLVVINKKALARSFLFHF